jgi:hypothetical protein
LRYDPGLGPFSRVWPLETGFTADAVPDSGPFVLHAEIWPGVLEPDPVSHPIADARQVLALVQWARQLDIAGDLAAEFSTPSSLNSDQIDECVRQEGWTLGATNLSPRERQPESRSRPSPSLKPTSVPVGNARYHIDALYRSGLIDSDERDELVRRLS